MKSQLLESVNSAKLDTYGLSAWHVSICLAIVSTVVELKVHP